MPEGCASCTGIMGTLYRVSQCLDLPQALTVLTFMKVPMESSLKDPMISQESRSLPSHLCEISPQLAEAGQIPGVRWESVIKDMMYWPPESISAGSTPSDNKRDVPVGKSLAVPSGHRDYQLGGNFKKANHTRKKCYKIYCTLATTQIQSCPLPACPDSPFHLQYGDEKEHNSMCDCTQRCRLVSL